VVVTSKGESHGSVVGTEFLGGGAVMAKHDFEIVSRSWQEDGFWSHQPLTHTVKKMVCKKCGLVLGPDSKDGSRKKCVEER